MSTWYNIGPLWLGGGNTTTGGTGGGGGGGGGFSAGGDGTITKRRKKKKKNVMQKAKPRYAGSGGAYGSSSGGGGGGSASSKKKKGTTSGTVSRQQISPIINTNPYGAINKRLNSLYSQYGNIKTNYTPQKFSYQNYGGKNQYATEAQQRTNSSANAQVAALGGQQDAANRAYQQAINQTNAATQSAIKNMNAAENQDIGRYANMAANMGMQNGFGNMANNYGITNDYMGKKGDIYSQGMTNASNAAVERANAIGGIAAQMASINGGRVADYYNMLDQLDTSGFNQYNTNRESAYNAWAQNEQNRYNSAQQSLERQYGNLAGQENILDAMGGYIQDARNFNWNDYWKNREYNYTSQQDALERQYRNTLDATNLTENQRQFDTQRNDALSQYQRQVDFYNQIKNDPALARLLGLGP